MFVWCHCCSCLAISIYKTLMNFYYFSKRNLPVVSPRAQKESKCHLVLRSLLNLSPVVAKLVDLQPPLQLRNRPHLAVLPIHFSVVVPRTLALDRTFSQSATWRTLLNGLSIFGCSVKTLFSISVSKFPQPSTNSHKLSIARLVRSFQLLLFNNLLNALIEWLLFFN